MTTNHGSSLLKAGDYRVESFTITSLVSGNKVDLRGLVAKFEVYEDIFSPYLTAKLYVEDSLNFPERLPISGQESVEIVFKTDVDNLTPVRLQFRVYKMDTVRIGASAKSQSYTLHLMSVGGYLNYSQFCGYSLKGNTSTMVSSIFEKHFPESVWKDRLFIETTKDTYSLVVPAAYTPFKAVSWLASRSFSDVGKEYTPYFFYETLDGYSYKSLRKIAEDGKQNIPRYVYAPSNLAVGENQSESVSFSTALPPRYHKVLMLEDIGRFDVANTISSGVVSSKLVVHDLVRKQARETQFLESDVFESKPKFGTQPFFKQETSEADKLRSSGTVYFYLPTTSFTTQNKGVAISDNFQYENVFLKRKHHSGSLLTHKVAMAAYGDSRRRVGDTITLDISRIQSDSFFDPAVYDKNFSGEYLITSVKHEFTSAYVCKYELSKTCMGV